MASKLTVRARTIALAGVVALFTASARPCTVAIISADASASGRPILWKNRDSGTQDSKVAYIPGRAGVHGFVAVFNASDRDCQEAWIGYNDVGFAIMNSASYNLKDDAVEASKMDREGFLMRLALESCATVDDFQSLLESLPRPLGVEANFGVIDACGHGAFFETNNHAFTRFDLADAPDGMLVRTNYSHSGRAGEGYGFTREANALKLLTPMARQGAVSPEFLTETLSRSFLNTTLKADFSAHKGYLPDRDFIPRFTTSSTVAIEGCLPAEDHCDTTARILKNRALDYIMWTALGYPPCAEVMPAVCRPGGVPEPLLGTEPNGAAPASNEAKARRDLVFNRPGGEKEMYIDMSVLFNDRSTGICQTTGRQNHQTYMRLWSPRRKPTAD